MLEEDKEMHALGEQYMKDKLSGVINSQSLFIDQLSVNTNLFEQLKSKFFNEMLDDVSSSGEVSKKIEQWLSVHSLEQLKQLNAEAKQHFLYEGITFTVYGEEEGTQRTIPYDLIPRVIEKKQWEKISKGCEQRVKALNLFLDDIYHDQHILKEQIVPQMQVMTHEAFQPHMLNHDLKGKIYSQISGIDIIRDGKVIFLFSKII